MKYSSEFPHTDLLPEEHFSWGSGFRLDPVDFSHPVAQFSHNLLRMKKHACWVKAPGTFINTAWGSKLPFSFNADAPYSDSDLKPNVNCEGS